MGFRIIGTGSAIPAHVVTNEVLSTMVDTSDEWISSRTGIRSRPICTTETATSLASDAAKRCLEDAGAAAEDLDLIVCASVSSEYLTPSLACVLQKEIGAACPAFDINAACTGFLYALDVADTYLSLGKCKKVLVVACEIMSKLVDWDDRATCVLFGDGCGAVLLEQGDDLLAMRLSAQGDTDLLVIPNVSGNCPFTTTPKARPHLRMKGQDVYKFAVNAMCRDLTNAIADAGLEAKDVTHILPHQANIRIVEAAINRLGIEREKYVINIHKQGNTSAASIPIMLDEINKEGRLKKGDILALAAFGGGLTSGACILRWNR